jgi:hypothetical protein
VSIGGLHQLIGLCLVVGGHLHCLPGGLQPPLSLVQVAPGLRLRLRRDLRPSAGSSGQGTPQRGRIDYCEHPAERGCVRRRTAHGHRLTGVRGHWAIAAYERASANTAPTASSNTDCRL